MYGHNNPTVRTTDDGEQVGPKMHDALVRADMSSLDLRQEAEA